MENEVMCHVNFGKSMTWNKICSSSLPKQGVLLPRSTVTMTWISNVTAGGISCQSRADPLSVPEWCTFCRGPLTSLGRRPVSRLPHVSLPLQVNFLLILFLLLFFYRREIWTPEKWRDVTRVMEWANDVRFDNPWSLCYTKDLRSCSKEE